MKQLFVVFVLIVCAKYLSAQNTAARHKISGGLLAGANMYQFKVKDFSALKYKSEWGFDGGLWLNFPLGHVFSIEPQALYSGRTFTAKSLPSSTPGGKLNFISIPILLKLGLGRNIAIMGGPQFDFLTSYKDGNHVFTKGDWLSSTIGITAGVEIFPHSRLTGYARYAWGTSDMFTFDDDNSAINPKPSYKMNGLHIGIKLRLFGGIKAIQKPTPVAVMVTPPVDTDGDGIADNEDKCPTIAGVLKYNGCPIPDTDGDGINDEADKCPTVPGTEKYQGCPIPDTDRDGINDEIDKCPTVAGLERYQGCPIPDSDSDGINDEEDKCKNTAGLANNHGCPEMIFYYKRDAAGLSKEDMAELDKLVEWMNRHPELSISIEGHTSTIGTAEYNQKLSEKRAQNCVKYVISKGIESVRLKAVGFGEQFPVGDNTKEEGRKLSRRVIMRIL